LIGGLATIDGEKMVVIGHQKGRNTKESLKRNFGCAHPEGYRKALRLMRLANKFDLPIVSMIDTPGAYPGVAAEERHIAEAIAVNIREMFTFEVPILAIVIGEGGSGGALGIGVANRVLVLENAYYSVISPEGCASILWRDRKFTAEAAAALKMSAKDLLELGLVEGIVPEPERGAHHDWDAAAEALKISLLENVRELKKLSPKQRIEQRQERFRNLGIFSG
jgi:acetyl-CoA carboxylase carboxyl transferase subunit alpha